MLSPAAQDVPLGQEMLPPSPEHLAVALCVSLCWMSPCAFVCGSRGWCFPEPREPEGVCGSKIQGQTDGWELPGEHHQSGVAAPSTAKWDISTPYLHGTFPA